MDDLNVLARDLGYRPQGKSAPMRSDSATDSRPSAVQSSSTPLFNDVYGGSPTFMNKSKNNHKNISNQTSSSMNDFNINSKNSKNSSGPVYDDNIFEGLPGLKSKSVSSSTTKGMRFEGNVSSSMASPTKHNQRINDHFDDLLGDLGSKTEAKGGRNMNSSNARGFDDLLGGFGSSSPASSRTNPDSHSPLKPDPFVVLDSTSKDPLDELSHIGKSESSKVNDNLDPLHVFGKSTSPSSMGQGTKTSSNKEHSENFEESPTSPGYLNKKFEEKISPKSRVGEIWLSVSEIPLFTTPTKAPPPSRPPPPIPRKTPKSHGGGFFSERFRRKDSPSSSPKTVKTPKASHFNENIVNQNTSKQMDDMKEAMNRAESKFKHAKEVRDIEKEKEEEEKEKRRVERERERAKQVVERATREARERAAEKAQAERAAVHQAQAEARRRAERAAANKAAAEARERAATEARNKARMNQQKTDNDLESFFTSRPSSVPKTRPTNSSDHLFTSQSQSQGRSDSAKRAGSSNVNSPNMKKMPSTSNIVDDLSSIFGGPSSSGDFQEVEGETEERRRARLERHQRTQERAAKALAEKYQRDLQAQRDQEERSRIGESIDMDIKRWAAGKEGNLRALLSTLQYVLWPECGWQAVSLTDLITGASVKKMYRKATLCIHPDKVQQKGATLQQKYVAEKVFDLLKEAWNKFNSEELF